MELILNYLPIFLEIIGHLIYILYIYKKYKKEVAV